MAKRGWRWDKANSRLVLYVDDTEVGRFEDGELGFHGATAANKAEAYTQTYSTADRTIAAPTAEAPGDLVATEGGWGASSEANFDKIHDTLDKLVADNLDLRQAVTALIDDLQEIGLVG
jgi:hypothetical protein